MPVLNHYLNLSLKSKMSVFFICLFSMIVSSVHANTLEGVVTYKQKQVEGVLFIFAKKFDGSMPMPLAVKRIVNPKFPLKFSLSSENAMMKSIPFKGPFKVIARLTKNGDPMDKSGPQGESTKALKIGAKKIQINIK